MTRALRAERYVSYNSEPLVPILTEELPYWDYPTTCRWYRKEVPKMHPDCVRLLGCNDRYFLFTVLLHRKDGFHPWLFERCREIEAAPDGYLDLWARFHYKSSLGTFAGLIQEVLINPEITIAIMSCTQKIAGAFLSQIQQEFEGNEALKNLYRDVLFANPRKMSPLWSQDKGLVVRRFSNPKEATIEAHGLIDAQPTSRHFDLLNYDDIVTQDYVDNPEIVKKVTERLELSDNLGKPTGTRKRYWGTRWSHADTYGVFLESNPPRVKARIHPATVDGTANGEPVFMPQARWDEVKKTQRSTLAAQMLLNPIAGGQATFLPEWFQSYEVIPAVMNVYIMVDPSMGRSASSDRTAIAVIGVDPGGNKYLLDGVRHRMKLTERYSHLKSLHKKWTDHPGVQMVQVGYERYGHQVDIEVIEEHMERSGEQFGIEELNWSRDGANSKSDRIARLEPDIHYGRFYLPAVAWHPDFGGVDGAALWNVWTKEKAEKARIAAALRERALGVDVVGTMATPPDETAQETAYLVGQIVYRPMRGLTRGQRACEVTGQSTRIVTAIKRRDEAGDIYDLTRAFMDEARSHPFGTHDDLLDACSRVYDMEPKAAIMHEARAVDPVEYPDA